MLDAIDNRILEPIKIPEEDLELIFGDLSYIISFFHYLFGYYQRNSIIN